MSLWDDDLTQFARLLDEIRATQEAFDIDALCEEMDLDRTEIDDLFDRAGAVYEAAKKRIPKPGGKRYYRTVFRYEVLSDGADALDGAGLEEIHELTHEGHCSGAFLETHEEEVDGPTMARMLESQGSDPAFLQICHACGGDLGGLDETCQTCQTEEKEDG
jgi:hypothetical protein